MAVTDRKQRRFWHFLGGKKVVKTSKRITELEQDAMDKFHSKGILCFTPDTYETTPALKHYQHVLLENAQYTSIIGTPEYSLLLVSHTEEKNTRIFCIKQEVKGTVYQKYPYLLLNCLTVPEEHIVIILEAAGAKPEAIKWLESQCKRQGRKDIKIMDFSDFCNWVDTEF